MNNSNLSVALTDNSYRSTAGKGYRAALRSISHGVKFIHDRGVLIATARQTQAGILAGAK
jgi:hypothetical protein